MRRLILPSLLAIGTMSKRLLAAGRALFLSARGWMLCALLVIAALVVYYVLSDRYTPFTTDAFVQAFVIQVTARPPRRNRRIPALCRMAIRRSRAGPGAHRHGQQRQGASAGKRAR